MNEWVKKSIKLVESKGYLDKLLEIYPPEEISRGKKVENESLDLNRFFQNKKCEHVVKELIRLKKRGFKFPIENPYVSFLSRYKEAIDKNPKTVQKICDELFKMSYDELKEKLESPKKASRRMGNMFKRWLEKKFKKKFCFLDDIDEFHKINNIAFLKGGDKFLREYAEKKLECKFRELGKGLDFVAKVKENYIIGTVKFITDFGGSQDNQFMEAIDLVKHAHSPKNVKRVAIIDGVAWLGGKMRNELINLESEEFCFTALLLEEFINYLYKS